MNDTYYSDYSEITPALLKMARQSEEVSHIPPELYIEKEVKRGLRDLDGKGLELILLAV